MQLRYVTSLIVVALLSSQLAAQTVVVDRPPDAGLLGGGIIGGFYSDHSSDAVAPLTEVTFAAGVEIGAITVFTTNLNDAIPGIGYPIGGQTPAIVNIFDGSTLDAGDNTLTGGDHGDPAATVDYVATSDGIEITAANLNISLDAGTYLIGIMPILSLETNGQECYLDAGAAGQNTLLNNPGGLLFLPIYGSETINANQLDLPTPFTGMAIRITTASSVLKGDVNMDGVVNLLDVAPFVDAVSTGTFIAEADVNCDGAVNLLDVEPFVILLGG